jgi:hypothetical protein
LRNTLLGAFRSNYFRLAKLFKPGQVYSPVMRKVYRIELDEFDLGQLIDGLEVRAEAWEKTADYYRTGEVPDDFIVEECHGAEEAKKIAAHYRSIIAKILTQRGAQS